MGKQRRQRKKTLWEAKGWNWKEHDRKQGERRAKERHDRKQKEDLREQKEESPDRKQKEDLPEQREESPDVWRLLDKVNETIEEDATVMKESAVQPVAESAAAVTVASSSAPPARPTLISLGDDLMSLLVRQLTQRMTETVTDAANATLTESDREKMSQIMRRLTSVSWLPAQSSTALDSAAEVEEQMKAESTDDVRDGADVLDRECMSLLVRQLAQRMAETDAAHDSFKIMRQLLAESDASSAASSSTGPDSAAKVEDEERIAAAGKVKEVTAASKSARQVAAEEECAIAAEPPLTACKTEAPPLSAEEIKAATDDDMQDIFSAFSEPLTACKTEAPPLSAEEIKAVADDDMQDIFGACSEPLTACKTEELEFLWVWECFLSQWTRRDLAPPVEPLFDPPALAKAPMAVKSCTSGASPNAAAVLLEGSSHNVACPSPDRIQRFHLTLDHLPIAPQTAPPIAPPTAHLVQLRLLGSRIVPESASLPPQSSTGTETAAPEEQAPWRLQRRRFRPNQKPCARNHGRN